MKKRDLVFFAFEGGVLVLGWALTFLWPKPPISPSLIISIEQIKLGLVAFIPPLTFAIFATSRWGVNQPGLRGIYQALNHSFIADYIREGTWISFLILSILAGVGEEILFRCFLQPYVGIVIASFVFGILHAVSLGYFMIATAIGLYLGKLYQLSGESLYVVAFVHGLYDFIALLLYRRRLQEDHRAV